jgi:hypothetical protein
MGYVKNKDIEEKTLEELANDSFIKNEGGNKTMKRFGEVITNEKAFPEVEDQKSVEELVNIDIIIHDVKQIHSGKYDRNFIVVKASNPIDDEGEYFTFATGGEVLKQKILQAKEEGLLPLIGKIEREKGKNGNRYFDIQ